MKRMCIVSGYVIILFSTLYGMHQRYLEGISFNELSCAEQSLLVYDAITVKDAQRLATYIFDGWRHHFALGIQPHPTWTALAWAIFFNHVASVKVLIAAGANAASVVDKKNSALWFARGFGNREKIITLLERAGFTAEPDDEYDESCADNKIMKTCGMCCLCVPWLAFVIKEELYS